MASTYLSRTFSASPTSDKIMTFSVWFKRSGLGEQHIFGNRATDNYRTHLYFDSADRFTLYAKKTDGTGNDSIDITTTRKFRDTNGWYHLVVAIDTTQATTADRVKIYFNGVLETSFAQEVNPAQNDVMQLNKDLAHEIGSYDGTNYYYNGYMSHIHFIDGTQYAPSAFGETDSNGVWKIKTSPSVTYGNHGFFILKDGNSVTDQSGNSNDWAVTAGTLTDDKDNPSNVFCTWNINQSRPYDTPTYSNGSTTVTRSGPNWAETTGSIGATKGKYYWEMKPTGTVSSNCFIGICSEDWQSSNRYYDSTPYNGTEGLVLYFQDGRKTVNGTDTESFFSSYTANDIIGVALDLDSATKTVTFYKNDSISGSTINLPTNMQTNFVLPVAMFNGSSNVMTWNANWGNGYFGTTAVSSAGTNASGHGVFEYDVPSGYTALCTKGLNE